MDCTLNDRKRVVAAAVATVAVAFFMQKVVAGFRKRRRLTKKIQQFRQEENGRREVLRSRGPGKQEEAITSLSFAALSKKLKNGELKAVDVLHAYQRAALLSTEKTNSVTEFIIENAEKTAARLDSLPEKERGPLHGIPVSVKECFFYPGTETTAGFSQKLGCFKACCETAPAIQFLENLGCVVFCKTNIPQAMLSNDSRNAIYGITRNPHNLNRGPGGSSSGEAALVGGKASILGLGSDIGGSLRLPAAWCGCYTLKPTSTRMLQGGAFPSMYHPRVVVRDFHSGGYFTQDIDALVSIHRLLYSADTFNKFPQNVLAPVPFREELYSSKNPTLTIGYFDDDGVFATVPAIKRGIAIAKEALEKQGHRLVPWKVPNAREAALLYLRVMSVDGIEDSLNLTNGDIEVAFPNKLTMGSLALPMWFKRLVSFLGAPFVGDFPAAVLCSLAPGSRPHDMNLVYQEMAVYRSEFKRAFSSASLDAILVPSFSCPAVPLDVPRDLVCSLLYTALFNLIDWPAGICPVTRVNADDESQMASYPAKRDLYHGIVAKELSSDTVGLPIAVQIAAPQYKEEIVLRLMSEVAAVANYK